MPTITIFSGAYCHGDEIAHAVAEQLGYALLDTDILLHAAVDRFSTSEEKLTRALYGTPSFLNNITHEREILTACLRVALTGLLDQENVVCHGFAALLPPGNISHILRVCIIANRDYRIETAIREHAIPAKEANKRIRQQDNAGVRWAHGVSGKAPWDESLYDIILPMHSISIDAAVRTICENAQKDVLIKTPASQQAFADFQLAAQVTLALVEKGHTVEVESRSGHVTILMNKYVLRSEHYKHELVELAQAIPGVKSAEAKFGPNVTLPRISRAADMDVPSKILLVDDEVEFVHTLSERLKTRSLESSIVYDGEEALSVVAEDEPEVMILDLKMPGIDGLEVLRQVKKTKPNVEVIILTGHGSSKEKEIAEELGAFAYLEKPVDIEVLTETMKNAYKKIHQTGNRPG